MLDFADVVAINKFDKRGAEDASATCASSTAATATLWETPAEELPVFGTIASQFNDPGVTALYACTSWASSRKHPGDPSPRPAAGARPHPDNAQHWSSRPIASRYLAEIAVPAAVLSPSSSHAQSELARASSSCQGAIGWLRDDRRRRRDRARPGRGPLETRATGTSDGRARSW